MNERQRKTLDAVLGEGAADELEAAGQEKTKELERMGIAYKEQKPGFVGQRFFDAIFGRSTKTVEVTEHVASPVPAPWVGAEHQTAQKLSREPEPTNDATRRNIQRLLTEVHSLQRDVAALTQQVDVIRRDRVDRRLQEFTEGVPGASQKDWLLRAIENAQSRKADDTKADDTRTQPQYTNPIMQALFNQQSGFKISPTDSITIGLLPKSEEPMTTQKMAHLDVEQRLKAVREGRL